MQTPVRTSQRGGLVLPDVSTCIPAHTPCILCSAERASGAVHLEGYVLVKLIAITFKAKHSDLPAYLHDDLHDYQPECSGLPLHTCFNDL